MAVARSMIKREFVLSCDKELPHEQQTKFFVMPLSSKHLIEINDLCSKGEGMFVETVWEKGDERRIQKTPVIATEQEREDATVSRGLVGWENYKDEEGNEIEFAKLSSEERLNRLYPAWRSEIAMFIDSLNYPSEGELKN